jgi:hypothetical protein
MTEARSLVDARAPGNSVHGAMPPDVQDLVARLRAAADQMVAFSRTKTLLRDAAATIERLDGLRTAQTRL